MDSDLELAIQASIELAKKQAAADLEYDAQIAASLQDSFDSENKQSQRVHHVHTDAKHVNTDVYKADDFEDTDDDAQLAAALQASLALDNKQKPCKPPSTVHKPRSTTNVSQSRLLNSTRSSPSRSKKVLDHMQQWNQFSQVQSNGTATIFRTK